VSRGLAVVVLENPAEPLAAADFAGLDGPGAGGRLPVQGSGVCERHVRPFPIVVVDVLRQQVIQVPGAEDDKVVEALDLDALDQALDVRVEIRRAVRKPHGLDPGFGQRSAEGTVPRGELIVAVAEEELGLGHPWGQRGREPSNDLREPGTIRVGGFDFHCACDSDQISIARAKRDKDGGKEIGVLNSVTRWDDKKLHGGSWYSAYQDTTSFSIRLLGRPNRLANLGMDLGVGWRSSFWIWHEVRGSVWCANGKGFGEVYWFDGSAFPSHRLWINGGAPTKTIVQGPLSNLWVRDPLDSTIVR
jgi:hypothetical protein